MKSTFFVLVAFVLFSCGNEKQKVVADTSARDSIANAHVAANDSTPDQFIAYLLGGDTLEPANASDIIYRFDQKMIRENLKMLSVTDVRKLFMPIDSTCDMESMYQLNQFFYLDSMNKKGNDSYRDLGRTVNVEVRVLDTIPLSNTFTLVAWTIFYSTYEACPYSSGTFYMISSYDINGNLVATQQMGMQTGGGDAPYSFTSSGRGNLFADGSFKIAYVDTTEDSDAPKKSRYEITRKNYRGKIEPSGHIIKEEIEDPKN